MASYNTKNAPRTDVFLTHDWGVDGKGRKNHLRVAVINKRLQALGYRTWFDEEYIHNGIQDAMVKGIDNTRLVIVFLTARYMEKINSEKKSDNCRQEFLYSFSLDKQILCVTMDQTMSNPSNWIGVLRMTLGESLFVPMDGDFDNEEYFDKTMKNLEKQLRLHGVEPIDPPMKYCTKCKTQSQGRIFCDLCGQKLRDVQTGGSGGEVTDVEKGIATYGWSGWLAGWLMLVPNSVKSLPKSIEDEYTRRGIDYIDHLLKEGDVPTLTLLVTAKKECVALRDKNEWTPLITAAYRGHVAALKILLQNGATVDERQKKGFTAALIAAQEGQIEAVKYLLANGASPDDVTNGGSTILHLAATYGHLTTTTYIGENYKMLLDMKTNNSCTVLYLAVDENHVNVVEYLLAHLAHQLHVTNNGWSPLHIAAYKGHSQLVLLLLEAGSDVYAKTPGGSTPLDLAQGQKKTECVAALTKWMEEKKKI